MKKLQWKSPAGIAIIAAAVLIVAAAAVLAVILLQTPAQQIVKVPAGEDYVYVNPDETKADPDAGMKIDGGTVDAIGSSGKLIMKIAMFAIPLVMIVAGYIVYLKKYKISEEYYAQILQDLETHEEN